MNSAVTGGSRLRSRSAGILISPESRGARVSSSPFLWRRMWPPSACPIGNSIPQIGQPCALPSAGPWPAAPPLSGLLWLVRCPPSA
ncbi:hypothetical protein AXF42_Ash021827 [Apostasia shenzhenica]|uniref:Uncharacterized protein n=1 Tax=Apostasia shenzhenica TaxID=1088818 RepID=A0A2H9ZRC1_9ASPA|nr:hypothetical protein AXF42_Ash021827 [Apostasia shenzhenica]